MKFRYFKLGENYLKDIENTEKTLIVFNDYFLKNTFLKNRKKNILVPSGTYLTCDEFQKEIFITEKSVLTEAKRPLTFYQNISSEIKSSEKINNYYDIIDIADLFFNYYRDFNINLVKNIDEKILTDWQREKIEKFETIKKEYDSFLEKNNYIINDWIICEENFRDDFIKKFEKIIFVDVLYFSPIMKKVIDKLNDLIEIEFIIQGDSKIYNEKTLSLNKITSKNSYFNFTDKNIKIYETSEDMETIFGILCLMDRKKIKNIYFPKVEDEYFSKIMPKYFINSKLKVMEDTKTYKFMTLQNALIGSLEIKRGLGLKIESFLEFIENDLSQNIYNILPNDKKSFYKILEKEYRYINLKTFEEFDVKDIIEENQKIINIFRNIYDDLIKIKDFSSIQDFYDYFKNIGFEKISDIDYVDFLEKFHEVIFNIKSSENLFGEKGFKEIFKKDSGRYIYTLLIKYLEGIELKSVENEKKDEFVGIIKKLDEARLNFRGESYFVDINNNYLPGTIEKNKIFTDKQLESLGFITKDERINIEKYRFYQAIGNSNENIIFYKNEKEGKLGKSVFLEELMIEYNLKLEKNIMNNSNIIKMVEEYFYKERDFKIENQNFNIKKDLEKLSNKDNQITVGSYDIININECQYKYFFKNLHGLEETKKNNYGGSARVLGIIVHNILEKVTDKIYYRIIKENNFDIDPLFVKTTVQKEMLKNNMKYPTYVDLYFEKVLIPTLEKNIIEFYKKMEKELKGEKVKTFFGEKNKVYESDYNEDDKTKPDFIIKGRMDLVATTEKETFIIDYKTGSKTNGQLDIYSIILCGDSEGAKKYIYNVVKGELQLQELKKEKNGKISKDKITKEKLNEIFNRFVEDENFERTKKSCGNCEYKNICRKDVV